LQARIWRCHLESFTQGPCVIFCDLTTCYSSGSAWFQRLNLKCDELLSNFAFTFNLRRFNLVREALTECGAVRYYCSEEEEGVVELSGGGRFVVVCDPLDGRAVQVDSVKTQVECAYDYGA